jgi:hypothetical protein
MEIINSITCIQIFLFLLIKLDEIMYCCLYDLLFCNKRKKINKYNITMDNYGNDNGRVNDKADNGRVNDKADNGRVNDKADNGRVNDKADNGRVNDTDEYDTDDSYVTSDEDTYNKPSLVKKK